MNEKQLAVVLLFICTWFILLLHNLVEKNLRGRVGDKLISTTRIYSTNYSFYTRLLTSGIDPGSPFLTALGKERGVWKTERSNSTNFMLGCVS